MARLSALLWLSLLATAGTAAAASVPRPRDSTASYSLSNSPGPVLPPSRDPWYTAPPGFEKAQPGDILRLRRAPRNLTAVIANSSAVYNILYRTTDTRYRPSWAVTTLFVPKKPCTSSRGGRADQLLSYHLAYDSADVDGSPSYILYSDSGFGGIPSSGFDMSPALGSGWYINVPDYEGPLASLLNGGQSGHAILDSIRAVLSLELPGQGAVFDDAARYAMWGYSGGSFATEWAAELQGQYAPELNFSGIAIGGVVSNITRSIDLISGSQLAGLVANGLLGITAQYPEARAYLLSRLKTTGPYNATGFLAAENMNVEQVFVAYAFQDMGNYFIGGLSDIFAPEILHIINNDGIMGFHGIPQMPVFAYQAIGDEAADITYTDKLVARYCLVGANILFQRNTVGEHISEITNGHDRALAFLGSVLDGTYSQHYQATGCTVQNVTVGVPLS